MRLLFPVVEVTRSLSNLIKSGFVAFSRDDTLVIDTNKNHVIENVNNVSTEEMLVTQETAEEALAAALIRDVGLDDDVDDKSQLTNLSDVAGGVLGISEEEAIQKSEEILNQAKQEAEDIVNQAHEEAEKMRAAAYDEAEMLKQQAKDEGYQQGYEEGREQISAEYDIKAQQLEKQIVENELFLKEKEESLVVETERKMVELLCKLIPTITGISIENEKEALFYMINGAMRNLENSSRFVIRVSSEDYEMLMSRKKEIYGALNPNIDLEIFEDAKLDAMQCQIDTDNGIVDVSLDVQLNNLIKALKLMIQE